MFIVIEGIDGAGKGHQRTLLVEKLNKKVEMVTTDFPDHQGVIYKELIHPAISEEIKLSKEALFLSFALDQIIWQDRIQPTIGSDQKFFIADGYFSTNIVYQCMMAGYFSLEEVLVFAKTFGIAQPDLTIYLDVDPEIAMARKLKESGHDEGLDIYERSLEKQQKIRAGFRKMVAEQIFGKWVEVDGNGTLEEVEEKVWQVVKLVAGRS
ncbi:MAG: dTMP kinase [bacterium]